MQYDVVIIGSALAGASSALLLLRKHPSLRVLLVERSETFGRRVGEATVEISAFFLGRVLGLTSHLNESHLIKQGMRFWFHNAEVGALSDSSEIGPKYHVRLPSWQLDRAVVDQELLDRAVAAGAELWRPASVASVQLEAGGTQRITIRKDGTEYEVTCRWVLDGSGVAAVLARQQGWVQRNTAHPTSAAWARWRGVKDWDGRALAERFPDWTARCCGSRNTATNHLVGDGWWSWWIPLKGGDVSVGVVLDERIAQFPKDERPLGERLRSFLSSHPVSREMLAEAQWVEGDVHWRRNLAYSSKHWAGDGFAILGDAGAFLDPFYSPGMDMVSFSVSAAVDLVSRQVQGASAAEIATKAARHDADFVRSYQRWFEAVYKDKYEYMGDFELMQIAFRLDLSLYYLGIASQPFRYGEQTLRTPPYSNAISTPFYHLMRTYNARMAAMARNRKKRGVWGRANAGHFDIFPSFELGPKGVPDVLRNLLRWGLLELTEGWRTWLPTKEAGTTPLPAAVPVAE